MYRSTGDNFQHGALESEHRGARRFFAAAIAGIVLSLLIALGISLLILFGKASGNASDNFAVCAMLGLSLIFAAACAIVLRGEKNVRVRIFENGLIYERGEREQIFMWDEIEFFWMKLIDNYVNGMCVRTSEYTVQKASGERLRLFHSIEKVEQIGKRIDKEVSRRIFPYNLQTIKTGGEVTFGKIALTRQGIQKDKNSIGWRDVKAIKTEDGKIRIENQSGKIWTSVLYSEIPNASIFLALAERIKREG